MTTLLTVSPNLAAQADLTAALARIATLEARAKVLELAITTLSSTVSTLMLPGTLSRPQDIAPRCLASEYAAPAPPAPLRTFYVDGTSGSDSNPGTIGSPFKSCAKVNTTAQAGDQFFFKGTFTATDDFLTGTTAVAGTAAHPIWAKNWPGFTPIFSQAGTTYPPIWAARSYWIYDGLHVESFTYSECILAVSGASNVWVRNCSLKDATSVGVHLINAPDWRIEDCTFDNIGNRNVNGGDAWFIQNGSHRAVVVRNTVGNCGHSGGTISYQNNAEATCNDCIVAQNTIHNTWSGGLIFNGKTVRVLCACNDIDAAGTNTGGFTIQSKMGIEIQGSDGIYRYNRIWNCFTDGLQLQAYSFAGFVEQCLRNLVHNNTVFGCGGAPLALTVGTGANAADHGNNTIENNIGWANHTAGATDTGRFYNSAYQDVWCDLYNASSVWGANSLNGNILRNNLFARTISDPDGGYLIIVRNSAGGNNLYYTKAQLEATFAGCANNRDSGDPLFVSQATPDLHLQVGSPAINAGYPEAGISFIGSAPDLGAYELA